MEVEIPSPSAFLLQSPVLSERAPAQVKTPAKPRGTAPRPASTSTGDANAPSGGTPAPKRSKSRNGCMSCKKKRVKCDETKPTCGQCEKRNVDCDGYKIHYKWRSFENTTKQSRAGKPKKPPTTSSQGDAPTCEDTEPVAQPASLYLDEELSWSPGLQLVCTYTAQAIPGRLPPTGEDELTMARRQLCPSQIDPSPGLSSSFGGCNDELPSSLHASRCQSPNPYEGGGNFSLSADSPIPVDSLPPGTHLRAPSDPLELRPIRFLSSYEPDFSEISLSLGFALPDHEDFDTEISCNQTISFAAEIPNSRGRARAASPVDPQDSPNSSQSTDVTLFNAPQLDPSSPEMLMLRFDKETCGILSIMDGPSENPWRTLIWPLAKDSHALYHAISAMAALHGATTLPRLRVAGMAHLTKSISKLSAEMHSMSWNQILASALALCLSEGWDGKLSTGIKHLKGAKTVLNNALAQRSRSVKLGQLNREEAELLKFLSNTFVYIDAIARLTSSEDHDNIDLDNTVQAVNEPIDSEIDPLMGCATTLFPLLGKVGSLIQRVRRTSTNSLSIISEANELREQLLQWEPPDMYSLEQPEDPSSNIRHVLQTAEAYRRAILLHLHSAVTELSSEPSLDQAKGTLTMLAATPLSSRTMIVQIFPLLVGSCEMVQPDDRQWVAQRWEAMMKRLAIVSVSSCWKVVKEVWRRRDQWVETQTPQIPRMVDRNVSPGQFLAQAKKRTVHRANPVAGAALSDNFAEADDRARNCSRRAHARSVAFDPSCSLVPRRNLVRLPRRHTDVSLLSGGIEYTVRGQLHWLGVMSDWNWEVFL